MEHTDTLCGQNAEFYCVKAGGTYSNQWALNGSFFRVLKSVGTAASCVAIT
jgi:hypothetical protein